MNTAGADASTLFSDLAWPDFYALLGVPSDADQEQLRARLREAYIEATANSDHRNVERRLHYQMMAQRIVPQARRILLEERTRRAYDRQLTLHRNNDPAAVPYASFVAQLAVFEAEEVEAKEEAADRPLDNAPNTSLSGLAPLTSSAILSNVSVSQPAERQRTEAQQEVVRATSSTRLASSGATNDVSNAARDLFEQAHAVLRSEKKYAEMSSLPSFDSGNESRAGMSSNEKHDGATTETSFNHSAAGSSVLPASLGEAAAQETMSFAPSQTSLDKESATGQTTYEASSENAASKTGKTLDPRRTRRIRGESSTRLDDNEAAQSTGEVPILHRVIPVLPANEEASDDLPPDASVEVDTAPTEPIVALLSSRVVTRPEEEPRTEKEAQRARVLRVERGSRPLNTEQLRATNGQDLGNGVRGIVSSGREMANMNTRAPRSRVSVSDGEIKRDNPAAYGKKRWARGQRVLGQSVLMGLTALASAAAMFLILHLRNEGGTVAARTSLRIVYSSDLQPVMEQAQRDFASTTPGRAITLELRPVDSRDAMHLALGVAAPNANVANANEASAADANVTIPDIWIPGETLWSDRFNQVAGKFRRPSITVARSLAVSPLVLIARGDRASALKKRFPNHTISSWDALRRAVAADAPNHFGLTDPQRSGSGALVRLFMAREWCERNGVAWNKAATSDARLWKWMSGFEDNVPGNAALTGDMIKELVMGNSDRFWWGIGYESDALGWMKRGKALEIFYLPRTALAQHPFCLLERKEMTPEVRRARSDFETFLRSRTGQSVLLQNGFRPTEIRLSDIPNSPFSRADFRAKGLRAGGFRIDERINYDALNALSVQWKARY
ncbi:MAG TPA: substrate-binding domain-containing protein [Abditibacteriaceae bacterium]|nr:substrate-binding domain-containing protein [Abditibacteriaceae bacterium]